MPDAPHCQGWMLYEDYYQWLLQTLEIVKDIPEVNWIVKSHPYGPLYTDRFTTPTAVAPYENRYQHICHGPIDMHPGSLIDAADAVVTVRGTAGLEGAVFGKPCVLAGKSQYSGHAIAIEPQTEAEYTAALKALENPKPLSAEAIQRSKALSYLNLELARVKCAFLPELPSASKTNIHDSEQWSYMTDRLRDTHIENDPLHKNLMTQLELGFPHLLNFDKLATSQLQPSEELPLISVLTVCKNSEQTIRRCIESILSQDYANIEYVIQDGASTDGTLAIINDYIEKYGDMIKLHSEPNSGPDEAMFRGLNNCSGKIITICRSHEELLPGAVSWGFENMTRYPEAGGIYGDVYVTDVDGNITGADENARALPWDLEKYICWERLPNFCGSFFRSSALYDSGFFKFKETDCCIYDYYAKVGICYPIIFVPGWVGKSPLHSKPHSLASSVIWKMLKSLQSSIDHLMDDPATPEHIRSLRQRAYAGIRLAMLHNLIGNTGSYEDAKEMLREAMKYKPDPSFFNNVLKETLDVCAKRRKYIDALDFLNIVREHNLTVPEIDYERAKILTKMGRITEAIKAGFDELRLNPEHDGAQEIIRFSGNYSQGISELQNGKPSEALFYLDRVKQAYQQFPNLEYARATALAQLGKLDSAKDACKAELLLNADDHKTKIFLEKLNLAMNGTSCLK
jgi:glycosyltransferase involved in cell wall biosynthesis